MSLVTANFIKNNYPERIQITTSKEGNKHSVNIYLLAKGEPVKHLLTSAFVFRSEGEAKLHAEIVCQSIVDDKTLIEP